MNKHTLKEFMKHYDPFTVQIVCGQHLISIDTELEGSWFIIRNFYDEKFELVRYNETVKHLVLKS